MSHLVSHYPYRTPEQQKIHYDAGRSKTLESKHLERLAIDFNIFKDGRLLFVEKDNYKHDLELMRMMGNYWMNLHPNNKWGGSVVFSFS